MSYSVLDENVLVSTVCRFLERAGWTIESFCTTKKRGIDIIARRSGCRLLVEAKGATSATPDSPKSGKEWKMSGVNARVADALHAAAKTYQRRKRNDLLALALPDSPRYHDSIAEIRKALDALRVQVIWVRSRRTVTAPGVIAEPGRSYNEAT